MRDPLQGFKDLHPDREAFPEGVLEALRDLGQDPHPLAFAWELADLQAGSGGAARQDTFLLALSLLLSEAQGNTRMATLPGDGDPAQVLLRKCGRADLNLASLLGSLQGSCLVGRPGDAKPIIQDGAWLYTHRMHAAETRLLGKLRNILSAEPPRPSSVPESVFTEPVALNAEQRASVQLAMEHPLALITGGPGTGKTSIVVAILRALMHQPSMGMDLVALAAPTGKAAQRMGEAIRGALGRLKALGEAENRILEAFPEPMTLHRLLSWNPGTERFRFDGENPLPAKVVIVDEASMISLEHMEALLRSLSPGARLILLGDSDQLPSVEAGRAYKDLVDSLQPSSIRLTQSYRMSESNPEGRNILKVAGAINHSREGELWKGEEPIHVRADLDGLAYGKVELLAPEKDRLREFLRRWFDREVMGLSGFMEKTAHVFRNTDGEWSQGDEERLKELFTHFEGFRLLCVLREAGELRGVQEVNRLMHGWMRQETGEGLNQVVPFCAGEPIMVTSNDYRRGIFNGDQGLVLKVRFDQEVRQAAVFPAVDGFKVFLLEALRPRLELCYAMTVHKSQGSEYERIALILPRTNHKALTKELLYTALTRAKRSVVLLGERERVNFALTNPTVRSTGLAERLRGE